MTPQHCRVKHEPPLTYGDCLRACVATVMDKQPEHVPHFADDGASGDVAMARLRDWLASEELAPFITAYPGDIALADLLDMMRTMNPASVYILFGGTGSGDHCVVCQGGEVVHNPAWYGSSLVGPCSQGWWQVLVMGRV